MNCVTVIIKSETVNFKEHLGSSLTMKRNKKKMIILSKSPLILIAFLSVNIVIL